MLLEIEQINQDITHFKTKTSSFDSKFLWNYNKTHPSVWWLQLAPESSLQKVFVVKYNVSGSYEILYRSLSIYCHYLQLSSM